MPEPEMPLFQNIIVPRAGKTYMNPRPFGGMDSVSTTLIKFPTEDAADPVLGCSFSTISNKRPYRWRDDAHGNDYGGGNCIADHPDPVTNGETILKTSPPIWIDRKKTSGPCGQVRRSGKSGFFG